MKSLLFTFGLTYGGAFMALFYPFVGFLIYVCFAIMHPELLWSWSVPQGGQYSRVVAIGLLIGWMLHGLGNWQFGKAWSVVYSLIAFVLWSMVSASFAMVDAQLAWGQVEEFAKILLPFLVGITLIKSVNQLKALCWVILLSQSFLAYEAHMQYYDTSHMFDPNEWSFGGFDRNFVAMNMVMGAGLAFFLGTDAPRWWQKGIAFLGALLMSHVVLFSMSRGGMLALCVTGGVTFLLLQKKPIHYVYFFVALLIGLRLAGPEVMERFTTTFEDEHARDYSAQSRFDLWEACGKVILDHPVNGIGSHNWRLIAHNYGFTRGKDSHCTWLHIGAEMGMIGLALIVLFYCNCVFRLWPLTWGSTTVPDPFLRGLARW